jgi:glycosyltransferase involved in cell wall biosynthesis
MAKIKILQIITRMDWGGSPDYIKEIFRSLDPEVFEMHLVYGKTKNPGRDTKEFLETFKAKLIFLPSLKREVSIFTDLTAFFKLYMLCRKYRPDLVGTHTTKAGVLGRLAAICAGVKVIVHSPHGNIFYGYFNKIISKGILILEKCLTVFTRKLIVFTKSEKDVLLSLGLTGANKIEVMSPGLSSLSQSDHDLLSQRRAVLGIKPQLLIVGMVSRLEPVKGADFFVLAALEILKIRHDVYFLIVGEGSLRRKLELEIASADRKNQIIITGWRDDALSLIELMDVLVQPSLNEAIGRVLLEAQSLGVPVVATKVGGIPDIVLDGVTGILVPPRNTPALVKAITDLLDHKTKRQEFSEKGKQWVGDNFSVEKTMSSLSAFYKAQVLK